MDRSLVMGQASLLEFSRFAVDMCDSARFSSYWFFSGLCELPLWLVSLLCVWGHQCKVGGFLYYRPARTESSHLPVKTERSESRH